MNDKQQKLTLHLGKLRLEVKDVLINNDIVLAVENAMEDYKNLQPVNSISIHREKAIEIIEHCLREYGYWDKVEKHLLKKGIIDDIVDNNVFYTIIKEAKNDLLTELIEMI